MRFAINKGEPVALIKKHNKTKRKREKEKYIGLVEDSKEGYREIVLKGDSKFSLLPMKNTRTKLFVAGPTGCGKTAFVMDFMKNYKRKHPSHEIIIITADPEDKTIKDAMKDGLSDLKILDIHDEDLLSGDELLEPALFKNSLVFLDDTQHMDDEELAKKFKRLAKTLLGMGRHYNTSVAISSHLVMDYKDTRFTLSEAQYIVTYPNGGSTYYTDQFFKKHFSKANSQIRDRINNSNSRWCCTRMYYPNFIMLEKQIFML